MKKFLIGLVVVLLVLVIGLQLFLQFALARVIREYAIPVAEELLQVKIVLKDVSVNLFGGSADVEGLMVCNPDGFVEPEMLTADTCAVNVGVLAVFKGGMAEVQDLTVKNARLDVIRNSEGVINIKKIMDNFAPAEEPQPEKAPEKKPEEPVEQKQPEPKPEQPPKEEPEKTTEEIPAFAVRRSDIDIAARYIDHKISKDPFVITVKANATMRNIGTREAKKQAPGTFELTGKVSANETESTVNVHGNIDPISNPNKLSFDMEGTLDEIDLSVVRPYLAKSNLGIDAGRVSGSMMLVCREGVFDADKSVFKLTFHDVTLSPEKRKKMGGLNLPETINVPVHVGGTLSEPDIDEMAIANAMFSEVLKGLGASIDDAAAEKVKEKVGDIVQEKTGKVLPIQSDQVKKAAEGAKKAFGGLFNKIRGGDKEQSEDKE